MEGNFDDMPPPLEDMSEHLSTVKQLHNKNNPLYANTNDTEEIRLAPKKEEPK